MINYEYDTVCKDIGEEDEIINCKVYSRNGCEECESGYFVEKINDKN